MFKFITKKPFWVNLLVIVGIVLVLLLLFFSSLGILTRHNKNEKVPYVVGKNVEEARKILEARGFEVELQDSVYIDTTARLSVIRQAPEGDALVKANRTIYLTINRAVAPLVDMPDLKGFSYMSAKLYLQSLGLKLGDTSYTPDIAKNAVRDQLIAGKTIAPGTKVNMGTAVDLVLGSGVGDTEGNVPDLIGMTLAQARDYLSNLNVSISTVIPMGAVTDTTNAFIVKQGPMPFTVQADGTQTPNKIRSGQLIDIWISATPPAKDSAAATPATNP
ncbi:PASTA domain-containing protein [Deminuibacter soli]|uniref:PASTA domain-containing protein n=1 Tax=Deminuibacter soli TaxID=2291815 RepID=A0A3E1NLR5_9BACT|nr:PASTA domain-containing protein [Deminuibacter soli]RFM28880.1 PASTA domain-containing protein [Deminuibacter soli]